MNWFDPHIAKLRVCLEEWLHPENPHQTVALQKTVSEGFFTREEVEFQLNVFRENLANGDLEKWAEMHQMSDKHHAKHKKVLCLHAGNLPMVGLQDAIAVILSGADYFGKVSKKDPYLIPSFLESVKINGIRNARKWSADLNDFYDLKAELVLFAGSEGSVDEVKQALRKRNLLADNHRYLIRTAKTSIAFVTEVNQNLKEAMFLYEGKGCRSAGLIVSPKSLGEISGAFDGGTQLDHSKAVYLKAYYESINKSYIETQGKLIVEAVDFPEEDFLIHWIQGDKSTVEALKKRFGNRIQTIYSDTANDYESIKQAQRPPLYWKPDGIDVLESILS